MAGRHPRTSATKRLRRCIVSGDLRPKEEMIRFVIGPEGDLVADMGGRLPGRGIWLSAKRDMINTACAKKAFARAAGAPLDPPSDLSDRVERLLARRCLDLVGLARRAGEVVAGYDKTRAWLRAGKGSVLVAASDGAPGGRAKVRALAPDLPLLDLFSGAELGAALGRESAGHAVLARGPLAARLQGEAMRLAGFRTSPTESVST